MTSLRRALDAKKSGVVPKAFEVPAGSTLLGAASSLGFKVIATYVSGKPVAVDPARQREFDRWAESKTWIDPAALDRMMANARREAAEFDARKRKPAAKPKKIKQEKDRMKRPGYTDPSD